MSADGGVDDFSIKDIELLSLTSPAGSAQEYRRMAIKFDALTYNANTVSRRALLSATVLGGSVFVMVAGSLGTRYKTAASDLQEVQESFRAYGATAARAAALQAAADEADALQAAASEDDMARSAALEGTVGATSTGRVGYRYER